MERRYLRSLQRWIWLFLLAGAAGAGSAYFVDIQQPSSYTAISRLMIGPGIEDPNPDLNAFRAGGQLILTYSELPTTGPFLREIIEELGLDMLPIELREMIGITSNTQTQSIQKSQ